MVINLKKDFITKHIRFKDEKEIQDLISAIEGNYKEEVMEIMVRIHKRKDLAF